MLSKTEIAERVALELPRHDLGDLQIAVHPEAIRYEDACWYVPVQPRDWPKSTRDYFHLLADVESALLDEDNINVLLVPIDPA